MFYLQGIWWYSLYFDYSPKKLLLGLIYVVLVSMMYFHKSWRTYKPINIILLIVRLIMIFNWRYLIGDSVILFHPLGVGNLKSGQQFYLFFSDLVTMGLQPVIQHFNVDFNGHLKGIVLYTKPLVLQFESYEVIGLGSTHVCNVVMFTMNLWVFRAIMVYVFVGFVWSFYRLLSRP